jgi:hypothetical protein
MKIMRINKFLLLMIALYVLEKEKNKLNEKIVIKKAVMSKSADFLSLIFAYEPIITRMNKVINTKNIFLKVGLPNMSFKVQSMLPIKFFNPVAK